MKLLCDASSLIDTRFQPDRELPLQVSNSELITCPQQKQKHGCAGRVKPGRLVKRRSDRKIEESACLVPHAIVVRGDYAKAIMSRPEVSVDRLTSRAWILPVAYETIESVAELHSL